MHDSSGKTKEHRRRNLYPPEKRFPLEPETATWTCEKTEKKIDPNHQLSFFSVPAVNFSGMLFDIVWILVISSQGPASFCPKF